MTAHEKEEIINYWYLICMKEVRKEYFKYLLQLSVASGIMNLLTYFPSRYNYEKVIDIIIRLILIFFTAIVTLKSEEVKNLLDGKIKYDEYQENKKIIVIFTILLIILIFYTYISKRIIYTLMKIVLYK